MLAFVRTNTPTLTTSWLGRFAIGSIALSASIGCAPIAGLEEHQPYQGFPDSASVPCSNGTSIVNCNSNRDTAPQDGHFSIAPPNFEISGANVIDHVTGLTWYRKPSEAVAHAKAVEHCEFLPGDYRLPTRVELVSLLDFRGGTAALIDPLAFPEAQSGEYWTATPYGTDDSSSWSVNFCSTCNDGGTSFGRYEGTLMRAICVKNDGHGFKPGPFVAAGEENRFVLDERTGLMWMQTPLEPTTWLEALDACHKSQQGAYDDFRLPNAKELVTIIADSFDTPQAAKLQTAFVLESDAELWTSTPAKSPNRTFTLLSGGAGMRHSETSLTYLFPLCVRGPD